MILYSKEDFMQSTETQTTTTQETKQINETQIKRPKDWEIFLLNRNDVSFEAIAHVLEVVLMINKIRAMDICILAHRTGKAPIFKGSKDLVDRYLAALNNAKMTLGVDKPQGMGYELIEFEVVEHE